MKSYIEYYKESNTRVLAPPLSKLLDYGFIQDDSAYLLRSMHEMEHNRNRSYFSNSFEYEDFINHIHIEDYTSEDIFNQAFLYIRSLAKTWNIFQPSQSIEINCSFDVEQSSARVSFHTPAASLELYPENLNAYSDPFLLLNSREIEENLK